MDLTFEKYFGFLEKSDMQSEQYVVSEAGFLRFTKVSSRLGVYPVRYQHTIAKNGPLHTHDFFELFFVLHGKGFNRVGKEDFPIQAGDIIFVENRKKHAIVAAKDPLDIINICFLPSSLGLDNNLLMNFRLLAAHLILKPFQSHEVNLPFIKITPPAKVFDKVRFYSQDLISLHTENLHENDEVIRELLRLILLLLQREYKRYYGERKEANESLVEAVNWIREHSQEKISLQKLADGLGMSRNYFSSRFNQTFGTNLNEFVNEIRLQKAFELLTHSTLGISDIALETGFENVSNFHRVFKKRTGVTPKKWKELKK